MGTREYWTERAIEREEAFTKASRTTIEKELGDYYAVSLAHIQKDINDLYARFSTDNQMSISDAKKLIQGDEFRVWRMELQEYSDQIEKNG